MFKHRKIKKLFKNDDPKLVYLLRNKKIGLDSLFKTDEDLLERSIRYHKNAIAETELMAFCEDINKTNANNQSYVMIAIEYDNLFMFNKLIEKGARLDIVDSKRENALYYALRQDNLVYYQTVINQVEIKGFNHEGNHSALYAYLHGKKELALSLIEKGDFINHINKDGNTILHYAALNNDPKFAFRLLELGADVFIRNYHDQTVLDIAKEHRNEEVLIEKIEGIFQHLFESNNNDKIIELLENNSDVDDYSYFNIPSLAGHYAIKYNNEMIFNRLIRNIKLLNSRDYAGKTLLMYCLEYDRLLLAKKILYLDCDLDIMDHDDKTAIHHLLAKILKTKDEKKAHAYKELFNEFVECNADVNMQDHLGNSIIMYAIMGRESSLVDALINHETIDLNLENHEGKTPILLAYEEKDIETVQKIIASEKADINHMDKDFSTLLLLAMKDDNLDLFSGLLHYGADLNLKYEDGKTILMLALSLNKIRFVAKIFEYPFDVDARDDLGNTALMHAIHLGSEASVKALLKLGANKRLTNKKGNSPIYLALDLNELEIAKLLKTAE